MLAGWCGYDGCKVKVKEETKFTSRNIPFELPVTKHTCISCGAEVKNTVFCTGLLREIPEAFLGIDSGTAVF